MNKFKNASRLIDAAVRTAKDWRAKSACESVQLFEGYAEPGYSSDGPVATGDWNEISKWEPEQHKSITVDDTPSRLAKALEKLGVELEWEDEWTACGSCGLLVRTQADSYGWQASYHITDGELTCRECLDPAEHLESLEGNDRAANTISNIDPADHGYVLANDSYEAGWHPGQDASPAKIAAALREQGIERFVFNIDGVGQFDTRFSVYVHESEADRLDRKGLEEADTDGPSRAAAMERGLREASKAMGELKGDGVRYAKIGDDGSVEARVVSPEEFIRGIR